MSASPQPNPEDWVGADDIARLLGVSPRTVHRYRADGRFLNGMVLELPSGRFKYHYILIKRWLITRRNSPQNGP